MLKVHWLRAPVVSAASQGIGVVQLLLILARAGTNNATDAYFYLFNLGLVPVNCIVVGTMYPSLLNSHRISRAGLVGIRRAAPLLCAAFVLGGALWLSWHGRLTGSLYPLVALSVLNAVLQARLWFRAVAAEAGGNALWIAGVALPANAAAVAALAAPWHSAELAMSTMVAGLIVGNAVLLVVMARRRVGSAVIDAAPPVGSGGGGSWWFLTLSSSEYLAQMVLQSLAVLLPASGVSLLNIANKIVNSVSGTFVNATMPILVHQDTDSPAAARRFLRIVAVAVAVGGIVLALGTGLLRRELLVPAIVVAIWLVCSSASAIAARMSYRFLGPTASSRTIGVVVGVVVLAALSAHGAHFTLTMLLCAYAAIDGAAAMLLLWPLRDRLMSMVLCGALAWIGALWLVG
jgi:hypothetical protein